MKALENNQKQTQNGAILTRGRKEQHYSSSPEATLNQQWGSVDGRERTGKILRDSCILTG